MPPIRERLELCVTYVAHNISIGVRPNSVEFANPPANKARQVATLEGHIPLEPGDSFFMTKDEFNIGRSLSNDLCVDSTQISRSHVKIVAVLDESYLAQDLGSANGTCLNGEKLEKNRAYKLHASGELQLAGVFHIKFTDSGATFVAPETATIYGLTLSHMDRLVWIQGAEKEAFKLSNSEYKFLKTIMDKYPGHASHIEITESVWGFVPNNPDDDKRARDAIFNIVKRLRERLQAVDPDYEYIETVRKWGDKEGGYRFHKQ